MTVDEVLSAGGAGRFQRRLFGIFGLVWTADAMQVIAVGFAAASMAATFGLTIPQALQTGTFRLKALEDENAKLKRLLADTMLDNVVLKDLLGKN